MTDEDRVQVRDAQILRCSRKIDLRPYPAGWALAADADLGLIEREPARWAVRWKVDLLSRDPLEVLPVGADESLPES